MSGVPAVVHAVDLDRYPDGTWVSVDGIAEWLHMGRRTIYRRCPQSRHPLVLSWWGKRTGAYAEQVRAWYRGRTFTGGG